MRGQTWVLLPLMQHRDPLAVDQNLICAHSNRLVRHMLHLGDSAIARFQPRSTQGAQMNDVVVYDLIGVKRERNRQGEQ